MREPTPGNDSTSTVATDTPVNDRPAVRISEDWAATIVGLVLLVLVLAGVVTHGMLLGAIP